MPNKMHGFTLVEIMIVVAIVAILAAVVVPSYRSYVVRTKRADMMTEMQNIAKSIETQKLQKGKYSEVDISGTIGNYPANGNTVYTITATTPMARVWTLTATPVSTSSNKDDGTLTLNSDGVKCRTLSVTDKRCGLSDEWKR